MFRKIYFIKFIFQTELKCTDMNDIIIVNVFIETWLGGTYAWVLGTQHKHPFFEQIYTMYI